MIQKELKQTILKSLYARYKDKGHVSIGIKELATNDNIIFDSLSQLTDAVKSLKEQGFLNAFSILVEMGISHNYPLLVLTS